MLNFLKNKLRGYSFFYLLRLEIESLLLVSSSILPTKLGMLIRWFLLKLLVKKSTGWQWISTNVIFEHASKISIGNNVGINSNTYINGVGGVDIGDYVLIGTNVTIVSGTHEIVNRKMHIFEAQVVPKNIIIEDGVWIGSGSVILAGVKLSKGSIVGANSLVNKNLEEYSINYGTPAKTMGYRPK